MNIQHQKLNINKETLINQPPYEKLNYIQSSERHHCLSKGSNKSGHWSEKEQAKYYAFITKFQDKFNEKESRRQCKIFKAMAGFMKSRDPNQCRSHHHKMTKIFENIQETLDALVNKHPCLKKRSEKYIEELTKIDIEVKEERIYPQPQSHPSEVHTKSEPEDFFKEEPYIEHIHIPKMMDIGNLRTDATDGHETITYDFQTSYNPPQASFKGFPSTGLLGQSTTTIPSYQNLSYNPYIDEREQKWLECHEYYLKWISKLSKLMSNSELYF